MMETRTIAIAALVIALAVGALLFMHARPNADGLPHGRTS